MIALLLACDHPPGRPGEPLEPCPTDAPPAEGTGRDRLAEVRFAGEWSLSAGWGVRLANADGDRCDEFLVGEVRNTDARDAQTRPRERIAVLEPPFVANPLPDQASWTVTARTEDDGVPEDRAMEPWARFGMDLGVDYRSNQLFVGAGVGWFNIGAFSLGTSTTTDRAVATVTGPVFGTGLGLLSGRMWTGAYHTLEPDAFAGEIYLWDLPLDGFRIESVARAVYRADGGDYVKQGAVTSDGDVDGDGLPDLVIGAHARDDATGAVAVLSDPPDGEHRVWDIADATYDGTVPEQRFGDQVAAADLDGDGIADLLTGAPMVYGASAFHGFRGPARGHHLATDSAWTVTGQDDRERMGVAATAADLDGDGHAELVVARPANVNFSPLDGNLLVFAGPVAPGDYLAEDADRVVHNREAPGTGDLFGYVLRAGEVNDDGCADLAIGAPYDLDDDGHAVGSVHVLFGRPDLFE